MNSRNKVLAAVVGFLFGAGGSPVAMAQEEAGPSVKPDFKKFVVEEIIVTATRRETSIQDTSMSISVLSGVDLEKNGVVSISNAIAKVPGASLLNAQPGQAEIIMRGIGTDSGQISSAETIRQSTTSTYLDDFVVGNTFIKTPDIQLIDMSSVEVLKGPQGTLYGQSAMGGVVRYISNKPNPAAFEGGVKATYVSTGSDGFRGEGFLNIPLSDNFAARVVAYSFDEPGFISSRASGDYPNDSRGTIPGTSTKRSYPGQDDYNETEVRGARVALRWQPTARATLDAMYLTQEIDGAYQSISSTFDPTPYSYPSSHEVPPNGLEPPDLDELEYFASEPYSAWNDSYNLKAEIEFDIAKLAVMGSKQESEILYVLRSGPFVDSFADTYSPDRDNFVADVKTLEVRLVSDASDARFFDWLVGAWYEDTDANASVLNQYFGPPVEDPLYNIPELTLTGNGDLLVDLNRFYRTSERAVYGEVAMHLTDRATLTLGYRRSDVEVDTGYDKAGGAFDRVAGRDGLIGVPSRTQDDVNTYKVKTEYDLNDDILLFAQATSGYRPGGLNSGGFSSSPIPFTSDDLWNYEIGGKTSWLDGRWIVNGTVYFIDWSDIQLPVLDFFGNPPTFTAITANVGEAEIKGAELESTILVSEGLTFGAQVAYTDAQLKKDHDPDGSGGADPVALSGDRLPGSAEWTYSVFAEWVQQLSDGWDLAAAISYSYVGERANQLSSSQTGLARANPSYDRTDIRLGVDGAGGLGLSLFVDNLFDEIGQLQHGRRGAFLEIVKVTRPRTVGIQLGYTF